MALTGSEQVSRLRPPLPEHVPQKWEPVLRKRTCSNKEIEQNDDSRKGHPALAAWAQIKARILAAEHLLVQRLAGTVFLIRVASALLAFGSQILFARWMGSFEFGIYVYVWTWVLLLGQAIRHEGRLFRTRGEVTSYGSRVASCGAGQRTRN